MAQSILDVKGIGKVTSAILAKSGFKTANDLANTSVEKLAALPGFSETRAMQVIKNANDLITQRESPDNTRA
jgi:transcription termination factor NusA